MKRRPTSPPSASSPPNRSQFFSLESAAGILGLLLAANSATVLAQTPTFMKEGLVAHYPFEGDATDLAGLSRPGTVSGSSEYLGSGQVGGALRVQGDGSLFYSGGGHVLLPTFTGILTNSFTFSFWAKDEVLGGSPANQEAYIALGELNNSRAEIHLNNSLGVMFCIADGVGGTSGREIFAPVSYGTFVQNWKQIVMAYRPGRLTGFINGTKVVDEPVSMNPFPVDHAALGRHWWDGGGSSSARMQVTMDEVRIYNRALSPTQVKALYDIESQGRPSGPHTAVATAQVVNGFVVGAAIQDSGSGYVTAPIVTIEGTVGSGASAIASIANGKVVAISIVSAGSGYTTPPRFLIAPPPMPPAQARAVADVLNGELVEAIIFDTGRGYGTEAPPVYFIGGGGTGATGKAIVKEGAVVGIEITNRGSGYTEAPQVLVAVPPGSPSLEMEVSQVRITLHLNVGYRHQVQSSIDGANWQNEGSPILALEPTSSLLVDVAEGARLFRVILVP